MKALFHCVLLLLLVPILFNCTDITDPIATDSKIIVKYYVYGNAPKVDIAYKHSDGTTKTLENIAIPFTHEMRVDTGFSLYLYSSNRYNYADVRIRTYINNDLSQESENFNAYGTVTINEAL